MESGLAVGVAGAGPWAWGQSGLAVTQTQYLDLSLSHSLCLCMSLSVSLCQSVSTHPVAIFLGNVQFKFNWPKLFDVVELPHSCKIE